MNPLQSWNACAKFVDSRALRERIMLFVAVLALLLSLASVAVFAPLDRARAQKEAVLEAQRQAVQSFNDETRRLVMRYQQDSDAALRARLARLQDTLRETDAALAQLTAGMVGPKEMARLIEQVLSGNRDLRLARIENLPAAPLRPPPEGAEAARSGGARAEGDATAQKANFAIYKHGLLIELDGSYREIVRFLQALEALKWKVLWDNIALQTKHYPIATVTLVLYTLSLEEPWLEV